MGDRGRFIEDLIAALQQQGDLAVGGGGVVGDADDAAERFTGLFSSMTLQEERTAADLAVAAYEQLQFDFPQAPEPELKALAELYRSFATDPPGASRVAEFALTRTLVEGISYLNEHNEGAGKRMTEGSSMLAAAVLLIAVRYCLGSQGNEGAEALLAKLDPLLMSQAPAEVSTNTPAQEAAMPAETHASDFEEKFAAQEDPDDLSQVYEGDRPVSRLPPSLASAYGRTKVLSTSERLRFLASNTFSSSFAALSVERWQEWDLDGVLCSIMRQLALIQDDSGDSRDGDAFFGPDGEWTKYLYILRDHLLQFPSTSQRGVSKLKELVECFHERFKPQFSSFKSNATDKTSPQRPHHLVYRVFAELVVSKEFQQRTSQRAQEGLASAIYDLLPLIVDDLQHLTRRSGQPTAAAALGGINGDLVVIFLQLLHFMMLTAANVASMAEKLHGSGMLRTLLTLLPASPPDQGEMDDMIWFRPLFRLIGECALWHGEFAGFVVRVPKVAGILPSLHELLPAESFVLTVALLQHQVPHTAAVDVWELFESPAIFPRACPSFLEAMEKVRTIWMLCCCAEVNLIAFCSCKARSLY